MGIIAQTPRWRLPMVALDVSQTGTLFDIKELALHDGPCVRITVFLKGCPLRCTWCHNPEGQSPQPQTVTEAGGTRHVGWETTPEELAQHLNRRAPVLHMTEGGVTFSGGEPLAQAAFLVAVMDRLDGLHVVLDTCGYGEKGDFKKLVERSDLVLYDLKLVDPDLHRRYTGADNEPILRNFDMLDNLDTPYIVRVPLVPGVTDTRENLSKIAGLISSRKNVLRVEMLPYNRLAGGKYAPFGMPFQPGFDERVRPMSRVELFDGCGVQVKIV
jgi:pyruvate formate lyase activating enzyme